MQLFHSTDMDGVTLINPCADARHEIVMRLDGPDAAAADHPDVSLVHDASGWSLSVFPSGIVTFENLDTWDDQPRFMTGISRKKALKMWQQLACGDISGLQTFPWQH
jgi:hypothetical protein